MQLNLKVYNLINKIDESTKKLDTELKKSEINEKKKNILINNQQKILSELYNSLKLLEALEENENSLKKIPEIEENYLEILEKIKRDNLKFYYDLKKISLRKNMVLILSGSLSILVFLTSIFLLFFNSEFLKEKIIVDNMYYYIPLFFIFFYLDLGEKSSDKLIEKWLKKISESKKNLKKEQIKSNS